MEFLKTCNTNAQAIGDFEAVAFQAFSVARNPTRSSSNTFDWNNSDDIRVVEAELRKGNHIVLHDVSRSWLWLFRAATADQVGHPPLDPPTLDDFCLNREQHGVMKAQELEQRSARNPRNAPPSASSNSPVTPRPQKAIQSGVSQQSQGGTQSGTSEQQQHDVVAIYGLFTSAVVALISFRLVKDYNAVALNYRTFASPFTAQLESDSRHFHTKAPLRITNVDVSWATAGALVVSTFSLIKSDMHSLAETLPDDEQKYLIGKCVRVAPNGILAKLMSFTDPVDTTTDDPGQKSQRKRPRVSPLEKGIEKWKASVKRWLSWKGYSIPHLGTKESWVRIQFAHTGQTAASSPAFSRPTREILWPRALCFYFVDPPNKPDLFNAHEESLLQEVDALAWFETPHSKGYQDPIDVAQQWFLGKMERDKVAEAQRKAKKAEEDAARAKEENHGIFPSSPLNARAGTYGDLQSVSGVYPTPPDGVPPGTVLSCGDTPSVSGLATNVILAPGGNNPAINLSVPQDITSGDAHQQSSTSPNFDLQYEDYNADGNNDDLFEDMDEGNFDEGNGITDADFNFFDDADDEDVIMPDAPPPADTGVVLKEEVRDSGLFTVPEAAVKEEPPDPMAALDFALASASAATEKEKQDQEAAHAPLKMEATATASAIQGSTRLSDLGTQAIDHAMRTTTPPLSPRFIETALLPSPKDERPQNQSSYQHRDSVFDALNFSHKMSLSDAKYKAGRFMSVSERPKRPDAVDDVHRKQSLRDLPLMTKLRYAIGVASAKGNLIASPRDMSDSDDSDASSETSSESEEEVNDVAPMPFVGSLIIPVKRKLPTESVATPVSATSFADSFGGDLGELIGLQTDESALVVLEPTIFDWSLIHLPPPMELTLSGARWNLPAFPYSYSSVPSTPTSQPDLSMNMIEEKPLSGKDNIAIAQIVTDQIASATLDILQQAHDPGTSDDLPSETQWQSAIKTIFPQATACNVASLAAVQDVFPDISTQMKAQQRPPPRRPNDTSATALGHHTFSLNAPYVRVKRADTLWDLLPPAIPFWETLGLGPCSPLKNVVALGIYPYSEALKPCVESFLVNMQLAYDSCKLGNHTRADALTEYPGGLVPCKIGGAASLRTVFKALRDTCIQLSKVLAASHAQMRDKDDSKIDAFVIYMIDPFEQASAIWELCSAFWSLFQSYQQPAGRPDQIQKPDLVLQIIPIRYIASFEAPVILDSNIYTGLAREVYDRCPPSAASDDRLPLSIYSAPSFQLEETIPRNIQFKLMADTPQDLMRENSYMHIGYAISLDGTWVTAAWSDTCGKSQAVVSYNLGTRPFADIAREIWQTTIEIIQVRRVTWRVCIAKAGVMEREELEAWVFLVQCPTVLNLFTTLMTIDMEPHLKFTPTMPPQSTSASSPGSTPQAVVSPEQGLTPAATPAAEISTDPNTESDARLVDMTDETWGIILAHRLHNSNSTNEYRPALISGLLVKRGLSPPMPLLPPPRRPNWAYYNRRQHPLDGRRKSNPRSHLTLPHWLRRWHILALRATYRQQARARRNRGVIV
ncbi:mediator of RNA polymerase II transcription subunit 13 [Didymosphaeria variabile]|uniref:Mediator of RNA polymerase II transcription subunit 13 n=1 Tax=Didymosphaeria variabile TaxID=1932322 RepID=A0A9W8XFV6_9PLEO|nr:mediator of RNA polymerase II transcription subunit 13 [Didymosphaeria variabile]KAJ4349585.1 mediator of RNA polymerase II transcription subunit 13 [Didymosphaeria variabile]